MQCHCSMCVGCSGDARWTVAKSAIWTDDWDCVSRIPNWMWCSRVCNALQLAPIHRSTMILHKRTVTHDSYTLAQKRTMEIVDSSPYFRWRYVSTLSMCEDVGMMSIEQPSHQPATANPNKLQIKTIRAIRFWESAHSYRLIGLSRSQCHYRHHN